MWPLCIAAGPGLFRPQTGSLTLFTFLRLTGPSKAEKEKFRKQILRSDLILGHIWVEKKNQANVLTDIWEAFRLKKLGYNQIPNVKKIKKLLTTRGSKNLCTIRKIPLYPTNLFLVQFVRILRSLFAQQNFYLETTPSLLCFWRPGKFKKSNGSPL